MEQCNQRWTLKLRVHFPKCSFSYKKNTQLKLLLGILAKISMAKNTQLNNGAKKFINTTQRIHLSTASLISYIGKFLKFCRIYLVKFRNTIDKIITCISRKEN